MSEHDALPTVPAPDQVRAALERIVTSDVFRSSPQLAAFLSFVVEAVLHGKGERIKGYTIGVEVLRRDPKFDPQLDPIVRVEATRLRRALERYYAGPGADAPVIIGLARGTYVPTFSYRNAMQRVDTSEFRLGNGMPTLLLRPLEILQTNNAPALSIDVLYDKLCDAFARFDTINIVTAAGHSPESPSHDYELGGSIETSDDRVTTVRFRLTDSADKNIIWSRAFERPMTHGGSAAAENKIITELAAILLQPFGVIRAHERVRHLASNVGDPRYRCIVESSESFRSFEPAQHLHARASLERLTAADPSFAIGFAYLAAIYFREYQYGYSGRPSDRTILDRALEMARRSVELRPESSRAYQILFGVLFTRGEIPGAFAAGDKARALNPYDMTIISDYGGRLVMIGEIERGMAMLTRAAEFGTVRPSWHHFYLFLGSYLLGDLANTVHHANQIVGDNYALGLIARALAASASGEPGRAAPALNRLAAINPAWKLNLRGELDRLIPVAALADRITTDLGRVARATI
ncbi:MAG TPA: hypothetical protein VFB31_13275 [Pseudolabrys sp.]|nr:hypothetical protein [Pseudolabrys sp.]